MRRLQLATALGLLWIPAAASAERLQDGAATDYVAPVLGWMEASSAGRTTLRQVLPRTHVTSLDGGPPVIFYLNHNGAYLSPGENDSRTNHSSLVTRGTAVPGWPMTPEEWSEVMACTRNMWAPFNVTITDVDPGNVPHLEALVTTTATAALQRESYRDVRGLSPWANGCEIIPNSIVFAFPGAWEGSTPASICNTVSQELGHSFGLDHEMLASDPMTYLTYSGTRAFRDQEVSCGEKENRACGWTGTTCGATQNSYQMLIDRIGPARGPAAGAPTIAIRSPAAGARVRSGFHVVIDANDDGIIGVAELFIDGELADFKLPPFTFLTDIRTDAPPLTPGRHNVQVVVTDNNGQTSGKQISVTVSDDAPADDGGGTHDDATEMGSGCQVGGGTGGLALLGLALVGLIRRRR